jgi:hypothetical protein
MRFFARRLMQRTRSISTINSLQFRWARRPIWYFSTPTRTKDIEATKDIEVLASRHQGRTSGVLREIEETQPCPFATLVTDDGD